MAHTRQDVIKAAQNVVSAHAAYRKILHGVVAAMDNVERAISMLGDLPPMLTTEISEPELAEISSLAQRLKSTVSGNGRAA